MKDIDIQFHQLPKEYFAKKFSDPSFPPMEPGISWGMFFANMLFYILSIIQCVDGEDTIIKYTSIGVMTIAALMFLARIYWGKKAIKKHKVGFIYFVILIFCEFRLLLLSMIAYLTATLMTEGCYESEIVIPVYISAAVMLVIDIVLNIVFWKVVKRKTVEGAFKKSGKGFFGDIKNKGKISSAIQIICRYGMTLCLAFIPLSRFLDFSWDTVLNPLLGVVAAAVALALTVTFAYADALIFGRAHYVKKFEIEANEGANDAG